MGDRELGAVRARIVAIVALLACGSPAAAIELDFGIAKTLEYLSLPVPDPARPIVCHGFGCAYQTPIQLRPSDIAQLTQVLRTAREGAVDERRALAATMAWFEKRVAAEAGTAEAKARAGLGHAGDPSQFDCLDKTTQHHRRAADRRADWACCVTTSSMCRNRAAASAAAAYQRGGAGDAAAGRSG